MPNLMTTLSQLCNIIDFTASNVSGDKCQDSYLRNPSKQTAPSFDHTRLQQSSGSALKPRDLVTFYNSQQSNNVKQFHEMHAENAKDTS